jgi:sigma-54 dependent transcriptional regulator, acetoin dehydrogenase operon transcriptional activator AcoR
MRGREAWRRTLEVKERFLAAGDPDRLPLETCGVRREIVMSWRRSLLSGVDAASTDLPRDTDAVPPDRLLLAARPVIDRLADQLAGTQAWAFLADRECRLVRYVVGDPALTPRLETRGAFPGARFAEDAVGTNGLGTAVEQRRPFIVAGSEHFRTYESGATTAGAPVHDPVTGRLVGLLNVNCTYEQTSELLLPFVTELAQSVEERLLAGASMAERALLEEFVRASRRCGSRAVVALSEEVFIANATALALLDGADCELLRHWACDAAAEGRERTAGLRLSPDLVVTARCRPLSGTCRPLAAVVTLAPTANPIPSAITSALPSAITSVTSTAMQSVTSTSPTSPTTPWPPSTTPVKARRAPRSPAWQRLLDQLDRLDEFVQVRAGDGSGRLPLLLRGERGTGKTTLAHRLHDQATAVRPGAVTILDAAVAGTWPRDWLGRLRTALADPAGTVVLRHLDALDPALVEPTASLLASARARLVGTAIEQVDEQATRTGRADLAAPAAVVERFPVVLDVPPLRERVGDISALVTEIIAELRPEHPRPRCTPEALAALAGGEWPGNVRQLRHVVATALVRSMSCDITVDDLAGGFATVGHGRQLTRLERLERQVIVTALRDVAWDREAAARDLDISRATIYRKMKRFGIRPPAPPATRGQQLTETDGRTDHGRADDGRADDGRAEDRG